MKDRRAPGGVRSGRARQRAARPGPAGLLEEELCTEETADDANDTAAVNVLSALPAAYRAIPTRLTSILMADPGALTAQGFDHSFQLVLLNYTVDNVA